MAESSHVSSNISHLDAHGSLACQPRATCGGGRGVSEIENFSLRESSMLNTSESVGIFFETCLEEDFKHAEFHL